MKKEELIKKIQDSVPDGAEVVIFDHRKNLYDIGDGSSAGIYKDFDVVHHTKLNIANGSIPYAALIFENDDYNE
jgi:phosphosulfolactate synthase (CoM biosynthesis protein A)